MADERFVLLPYAGVNPSYSTVYEIGIPCAGNSNKIACGINDGGIAAPVYYCRADTNNVCFLTPYTDYIMTLFWSTGNSMYNDITITSVYNVTGNVKIRNFSMAYTWGLPYDLFGLPNFASVAEAATAFLSLFPDSYINIQYVGNGCLLSGPSYVEAGTGVVVPVTVPVGVSLSADNISVTKNGTSIDFTYNSNTQQIGFTAI